MSALRSGWECISRGAFALLLNAVLGVLAIGLAFAAPGEGAPRMQLTGASGSLTLANSREGEALFRADAMRPGEQASGSVTIGNTGSVTGTLKVARTALADQPGGGALSDALDLLVIDVTPAHAPVTVYAGKLAQMPELALGGLDPGTQRTYLFAATLQRGGPSDNAYQGSAVSTAFTWTATGSDAVAPTATPTATPAPSATPVPTASPVATSPPGTTTPPPGPAGADPTGTVLGSRVFLMPGKKRCLSRRKFTITVRRPKGLVFSSIKVTVNRKTKRKLRGLKARKVRTKISLRGLPKGKVVVKIVARTTTGRKAVTKRTYHTCAARRVKR